MFRNYITIALRNLVSHKLYSAINILGLSIGLACVILIALFVRYETSYDRHWAKADQVYRVTRTFKRNAGGEDLLLATNAPQTGPLIKQDFQELEQVVRIWGYQLLLGRDDIRFYETGIKFTDPEVFEVFDIPMLQGDPATALAEPFSVILDQKTARKYFGDEDPMGQSITVENQFPLKVTGIMQDLPDNTHLRLDMLASLSTMTAVFGEGFLENWASNNFHTYILTPKGYDISTFEAQIPDFLVRHVAEDAPEWTEFPVQKLTDIHLHSSRDNEQKANGSIGTVYTFSAVAFFILLIACFNFMNLSTARSAQRAREVGMRKVMGAHRKQLVGQFLGESILLGLLAMVLAVALVEVSLPWFNSFIGLDLAFDYLDNPGLLAALAGLAILVGVFAGSYPAFYLSAFRPATVLKGDLTRGSRGALFRKVLVVTQFAISISLVIATGVVFKQMKFASELDLGLDKEQVVILRGAPSTGFGPGYETMKQELLSHPGIVSVTGANLMPSDQNTNAAGVRAEGGDPEGRGMPYLNIDYDFFETFDIDVIAGRAFSKDRGTEIWTPVSDENPKTSAAFMLNTLAARQLGWSPEEALGKWFEVSQKEEYAQSVRGPVIGVVGDVNFSSIREPVKPLFYRVMRSIDPEARFPNFGQMAVKFRAGSANEVVEYIEYTWKNYLPAVPISHSFLDDNFAALYASEEQQGQLFTVFSLLAIFIACLGLYGLAAFTTEQRTKEIGIRKVMGGSVKDIVMLLTKDFSKLVLLANVLAWPTAWFLMNRWLESFAYRIDLGMLTFISAALIALVIAWLTVGGLAARAAWAKPALALRYE
jgi:putative ABC transport system permease protein